MRALNKKLLRDLRHMWGQALAIALVMAAGVAVLVLGTGAYRSLDETRAAYYERYRFADVFASATRAPRYLGTEIERLPGVAAVEMRITRPVLIDIKGYAKPVSGLVVSLPRKGMPRINALYLREGRLPEPDRADEILVNESFAKAHGFRPGARLEAILDGRKKALVIVGIALSPEFVYALAPGDLVPNDKAYGLIWMTRNAAEAAFDMTGAFNSVMLRLRRDANQADIIDRLDAILAPYGGRGAYGREDQQSNAFLDAELKQLRAMSAIIPPIFLIVAAFLINMTLARLITLEREQIGLLKALGYRSSAVAFHYLKFASLIAGIGMIIGFAAGVWLGRGMTRMYAEFYHFPFLVFLNAADVFIIAGAISLAAAWLGGLRAAWTVARLSPAVAMAPPVPARYRRTRTEKLGLLRGVSQSTMMIIRHLVRYPLRAVLTTLGIASSGALLVLSLSSTDAINYMIDFSFFRVARQDVAVVFTNIKPMRIAQDLARLPGVLRVEPYRSIPVTLRHENRKKRMSLQGLPKGSDLTKLLGLDLRPLGVPDTGIAISEKLAEILGVGIGDKVRIETMDLKRRTFEVPVTAILQSYMGLSAYMELSRLNALLGDGQVVSGANLSVDKAHEARLYAKLKETPSAASIMLLRSSLASFRATVAENIAISMTIYVVLAMVITFGVVYNSARIQLSERGRELASLRVLGFTKGEVARILLSEVIILVVVSIPISWAFGYVFTWYLFKGFETDLYRVPFVVGRAVFGYSAVVIALAAAVSAFLVWRRIAGLDLIGVLKTRE